jgi:hypothetical protein
MLGNLKDSYFLGKNLFSPFPAQKHRYGRVKQVFKKGWLDLLVYQLYCTVPQ